MLDINPLSEMELANICSHSVSYPFIVLMESFREQKLFILMWSKLQIFHFINHAFGACQKTFCLALDSKYFPICIFKVLCFTFNIIIYF